MRSHSSQTTLDLEDAMTHYTPDPVMQGCIDSCNDCHVMCLKNAMTHCLVQGGAHASAEHMRLMLNCAELCQTAANFMLSNSALHAPVCDACAEVCKACALSCLRIGDMDDCADACTGCAESCTLMAAMAGDGPQPVPSVSDKI
jgi:hypothetical protein